MSKIFQDSLDLAEDDLPIKTVCLSFERLYHIV